MLERVFEIVIWNGRLSIYKRRQNIIHISYCDLMEHKVIKTLKKCSMRLYWIDCKARKLME